MSGKLLDLDYSFIPFSHDNGRNHKIYGQAIDLGSNFVHYGEPANQARSRGLAIFS